MPVLTVYLLFGCALAAAFLSTALSIQLIARRMSFRGRISIEYFKVYHAASTSVKLTIDNKRNIILHGVKWGQFIIRIDKGLKPLVSIYEHEAVKF